MTSFFSPELQRKIDLLKQRQRPITLGKVQFSSPLLLAPMSAITSSPFRLLMQDLGAGGSISELISCHGINYKGKKTLHMLSIAPEEKNVGIQLFGEDAKAMGEAAHFVEQLPNPPKFIDINMGCPVRKVVCKGAGSALLRDPSKLAAFFSHIKKSISLPLTIKIRTGPNEENINAQEIIHIAHNEGIEFVSIHGRTAAQQYRGQANWDLIEKIAQESPLPIIGNGDLKNHKTIQRRLSSTQCRALMMGRGPLRAPFLFLESYITDEDRFFFGPSDYLEVLTRYRAYLESYTDLTRVIETQLKKHVVWMVAGMPGASQFRSQVFACTGISTLWPLIHDYLGALGLHPTLFRNTEEAEDPDFMAGGHG